MISAFEKAKKALSVSSVVLRQSVVFLDDEFEPSQVKELKTETQSFRGVEKVKEVSLRSEDSERWEYNFFYSVGIRLVEEGEDNEKDSLLEITATFNATYKSDEKLEKDSIEAFSEENVGYHVWPYWREFVQSSCSRLDVPPIKTPLYYCTSKNTQSQSED